MTTKRYFLKLTCIPDLKESHFLSPFKILNFILKLQSVFCQVKQMNFTYEILIVHVHRVRFYRILTGRGAPQLSAWVNHGKPAAGMIGHIRYRPYLVGAEWTEQLGSFSIIAGEVSRLKAFSLLFGQYMHKSDFLLLEIHLYLRLPSDNTYLHGGSERISRQMDIQRKHIFIYQDVHIK